MNFTLDKQAAKKEIETEQVSKMRHELRRKNVSGSTASPGQIALRGWL